MRVLIIHNTYRYTGGEETYLTLLINMLKKRGHHVYFYTKNSSDLITMGDKIRAGIGLFWNFTITKELTDIIGAFKPDVVQFQNIFPLITPAAYWTIHNHTIPIVQNILNYRLLCPKTTLFRRGKICELCISKQLFFPSIWHKCYDNSTIASLFYACAFFFHKYILKSFSLIDTYIFPSKFTMDYITKNFPLDKKRTLLIPAPVTIPDILSKKSVGEREKYFLYVGRIVEEKGVFHLIDIFSSRPYKHMSLVLVGDGPEKNEAIKRANGAKNIVFKGYINASKIPTLMKESLGVIVPSEWFDVQPNVVLESLLMKVPVIAPNRQNFKEIINKNSGFLYDSDFQLKKIMTMLWKKNTLISRDKITLPIAHMPQNHYKKLVNLYKTLITLKKARKK